jgi:muconate cycloisomerase
LYFDGSYDSLLLKQNITCEDVSFGPGGEALPLTGPGLGVEINKESLSQLTVGQVLTLTP